MKKQEKIITILLITTLILIVASTSQTNWKTETVTQNAYNKFTQIEKIDGKIAISYIKDGNKGLVYAEKNTGTIRKLLNPRWSKEIIHNKSGVGTYQSLNSINGKPILAYQDGTLGQEKLYYASKNNKKWQKVEIDNVTNGGVSVGMYNSLITFNSTPRIFYHSPNQGLKQARRAGEQNWNAKVLESGQGWHITSTKCKQKIKLAFRGRNSQEMRTGILKDEEWASNGTEIRVKSDISLDTKRCQEHLVYHKQNGNLMYSYKNTSKKIDNLFFTRTSLEIKEKPHILYHKPGKGLIYLAKNENGWKNKTLGGNPDAGRYNDLEIDQKGQPHIVFIEDNSIKYATIKRKIGINDDILTILRILSMTLLIITVIYTLNKREVFGNIRRKVENSS